MAGLTFSDEIQLSSIDVPRAALRFAKEIAYPDLNVDLYISLLEGLSDWCVKSVGVSGNTRSRAEAVSGFLFDQLGFRGNAQEYNDPRNSYINEVIDRRLGIPISLSVIYIAVARKAGLAAQGVGLPGHFIVSVRDPNVELYIDPFHGGKILSHRECANMVKSTTGYEGPFQEGWLEPVSAVTILTRMLNNLRNIYIQQRDWMPALKVVEHLRLLQPEMNDLKRDLGIIYHNLGSLKLAIKFYEQYLIALPDAPDAGAVKQHLQTAAQALARLN